MGTCHGTPTGKGGFRLSLQGYAPDLDYERLTHEGGARRANRIDPDASLLLRKPLTEVSHRGGQRIRPGSLEHRVLRRWIAEGMRNDPPGTPRLKRLEVVPGAKILERPARPVQLRVRAHFSDGTARDVTSLIRFSSSDDTIAQVSPDGVVSGQRRGEAAILCRYEHLVGSARFTYLERAPGFRWPNPPAHNFVDRHVFAKMRQMRVLPAGLCTDAEFLRRATLDTLGTIPKPEEVRAFLSDRRPDKRARLIDSLLARPEFADFWALKWSDLLRVSEETLDSAGVRAYHAWIRQAITENRPLDQFARALLTASGNTLENPAANYYRAVSEPTNWMETTAQLFMGRRVQCAKCHNHPFDRFTQDDYFALAAFFAQVRIEGTGFGGRRRRFGGGQGVTVSLNPSAEMTQPRTGEVMAPRVPGAAAATVPAGADRRLAFARWLIHPANPYFAPAMANRIWFHLMGRGIVEPVDDFRDSNPSTNDALLAALARELVTHRYDLRHMVRTIMTSRTYQLSSRPHPASRDDRVYHSSAVPRLIPAEPLLDAIAAATGVPEEFPGMPPGTRAVQLAGTAVRSPFLTAFGRPARKLACECEREREPTLFQALQLISSRSVERMLASEQGRVATLAKSTKSDEHCVRELYLASLSRPPTAVEKASARKYLAAAGRRHGLEDLLWALINSKEFLFRH
jgi:hypothetical protein